MRAHQETHLSGRAAWLRAAVLGADDGIVSTAALMGGIAAASGSRAAILTAGVAGLVSGAMSMAAGEYVSVSSQRDAERADVEKERRELNENPVGELAELTLIYQDRGLDRPLAEQVAAALTRHDPLTAHLRDELGQRRGNNLPTGAGRSRIRFGLRGRRRHPHRRSPECTGLQPVTASGASDFARARPPGPPRRAPRWRFPDPRNDPRPSRGRCRAARHDCHRAATQRFRSLNGPALSPCLACLGTASRTGRPRTPLPAAAAAAGLGSPPARRGRALLRPASAGGAGVPLCAGGQAPRPAERRRFPGRSWMAAYLSSAASRGGASSEGAPSQSRLGGRVMRSLLS